MEDGTWKVFDLYLHYYLITVQTASWSGAGGARRLRSGRSAGGDGSGHLNRGSVMARTQFRSFAIFFVIRRRTSGSEAEVAFGVHRGLQRRRRQMRGAGDSAPWRYIVSGACRRFTGSTPRYRVFSPVPSPAGAVVTLLARSGSLEEKEELAGVASGFCGGSLTVAALAPHVASGLAFGSAKTTSSRVHARKVFDGMHGQCATATRVPGPFPHSSATPNRGTGRRRQRAARLPSDCSNLV